MFNIEPPPCESDKATASAASPRLPTLLETGTDTAPSPTRGHSPLSQRSTLHHGERFAARSFATQREDCCSSRSPAAKITEERKQPLYKASLEPRGHRCSEQSAVEKHGLLLRTVSAQADRGSTLQTTVWSGPGAAATAGGDGFGRLSRTTQVDDPESSAEGDDDTLTAAATFESIAKRRFTWQYEGQTFDVRATCAEKEKLLGSTTSCTAEESQFSTSTMWSTFSAKPFPSALTLFRTRMGRRRTTITRVQISFSPDSVNDFVNRNTAVRRPRTSNASRGAKTTRNSGTEVFRHKVSRSMENYNSSYMMKIKHHVGRRSNTILVKRRSSVEKRLSSSSACVNTTFVSTTSSPKKRFSDAVNLTPDYQHRVYFKNILQCSGAAVFGSAQQTRNRIQPAHEQTGCSTRVLYDEVHYQAVAQLEKDAKVLSPGFLIDFCLLCLGLYSFLSAATPSSFPGNNGYTNKIGNGNIHYPDHCGDAGFVIMRGGTTTGMMSAAAGREHSTGGFSTKLSEQPRITSTTHCTTPLSVAQVAAVSVPHTLHDTFAAALYTFLLELFVYAASFLLVPTSYFPCAVHGSTSWRRVAHVGTWFLFCRNVKESVVMQREVVNTGGGLGTVVLTIGVFFGILSSLQPTAGVDEGQGQLLRSHRSVRMYLLFLAFCNTLMAVFGSPFIFFESFN
ncbi:unnamed protein product [Amoebophrya sp. A120]|nr:unnamed protein product [Amoebophrya sp. A120]|eukprot:GSA120T00018105001.1